MWVKWGLACFGCERPSPGRGFEGHDDALRRFAKAAVCKGKRWKHVGQPYGYMDQKRDVFEKTLFW